MRFTLIKSYKTQYCFYQTVVNLCSYVPQTWFGRHIVFAPYLIKSPNEVWRLIVFATFLIIIIIAPKRSLWDILLLLCVLLLLLLLFLLLLFHFSHNFVRLLSRRCLYQTLWNLVGITYAMWSCVFKCWFFQNAAVAMETAKMLNNWKHTKMIIAGYSPNRNWWNLIGATSTSSGTR